MFSDPYLDGELSPYDTNALSSSLWEVASLRTHYNASVSSLSQIFFEAFTKPSYALEDFLDQSYGTVRSELCHLSMLCTDRLPVDVQTGSKAGFEI